MWRKGNPCALLVGVQTGAATVESSVEIPQKIKNGYAFWPSDPTSRNISKGTQNTNSKEHKQPYVHCSFIYNHQDMEAAQEPINRWVDKTTMRHLHNGILLGYKKEENFTLCNSEEGPGPQPRHVPWLGTEPATLWFAGQHSIYWVTPTRAVFNFLRTSLLFSTVATPICIFTNSAKGFPFLHILTSTSCLLVYRW